MKSRTAQRNAHDVRQSEAARQRACWRILGLGYITSTHKATDRCRKCGFRMHLPAGSQR